MNEQTGTAQSTDEAGDAEDQISAPVPEELEDETGGSEVQQEKTDQDYERAAFQNLQQGAGSLSDEANLDVILDIPVTLSMEIGRAQVSIQELLQLGQGSVVELDRMAGEPLDVLVNGTLIARGEVVVVNDKFGIRLSDVISPAERVSKLK